MKTIGFIGVGVMGKSMVRNLMQAGFNLQIYSRTKAKCEELINGGAIWKDTAGDCARGCDAIITMVGYPADVEQVYFSPGGILDSAAPGCYLIDMTTTSPSLSKRIAEAAQARGLSALDAPVSGGDSGAKAATLAIMVGGMREAFDACMPLFEAMGKNIVYEGGAGSGQHTKMANQIALAGALAGVCEALSYGKSVGLDLQTMLDTIQTGAAGSWQMSNLAPKMLAGDFAPGFYIKHYIKDMDIAREEAEQSGAELGVLEQVRDMFEVLAKQGLGDDGTQALLKYYIMPAE